jgi:hypothetical protein
MTGEIAVKYYNTKLDKKGRRLFTVIGETETPRDYSMQDFVRNYHGFIWPNVKIKVPALQVSKQREVIGVRGDDGNIFTIPKEDLEKKLK